MTQGPWPVSALLGVDETTGQAIFAASKDSPIERRLYAVSYRNPGEIKALTARGGWWTADVARSGGAIAATYDDPTTPPRTGLYGEDGRLVRWIEENGLVARPSLLPLRRAACAFPRSASSRLPTARTCGGRCAPHPASIAGASTR